MNKQILEQYQIHPKKIRCKKSVQIIEDEENRRFVAKKNSKKKKNVYEYLMSRNFYNFPKVFTRDQDETELTEYVDDIEVDTAQRIEDMIYLLSILHNKTTFYKEIDLDEIKRIYEELSDEYNYLANYYQSIQTMIEDEIYMSPAHYYFILNSSKLYKILEIGRQSLENWYQQLNQKKTLRFVLNHNYLTTDHFIENENLYFINWNKADIGFPSTDLINLFQLNYEEIEISTLIHGYESKYKLTQDEYNLLIAGICKLPRLNFNQNETTKIEEVTKLNRYIQKIDLYFSKQNSSKSNNYPQ